MGWIAWWGAVVSTALAVIKIYEAWTSRFRVDVGYMFSSNESLGNKITVRNLSDSPFILTYWEVVWRKGLWPLHRDVLLVSADEFYSDTRIDPCSSKEMIFSDIDHFDTKYLKERGRYVFIRLHIAGRRTVVKKVYDSKRMK